MSEQGPGEIVRVHPAIAEEFRKVVAKIDSVVDENRRLAVQIQDEKRAREALERQDIHLNGMPGKRLPYKYQINIPIPGGTDSSVTGSVNVGRDGPFVCRRIYASVLVIDAPIVVDPLGAGVTLDYSFWNGRYVPVTSSDSYYTWNNVRFPIFSFFYIEPPVDFEWSYNDSGSGRNREDKPISGDVLNRQDDDGYLMNNEIFAAGTTIKFTINPTRPTATITFNPPGQDSVTLPVDIEIQITFDGFKVLQPLEM